MRLNYEDNNSNIPGRALNGTDYLGYVINIYKNYLSQQQRIKLAWFILFARSKQFKIYISVLVFCIGLALFPLLEYFLPIKYTGIITYMPLIGQFSLALTWMCSANLFMILFRIEKRLEELLHQEYRLDQIAYALFSSYNYIADDLKKNIIIYNRRKEFLLGSLRENNPNRVTKPLHVELIQSLVIKHNGCVRVLTETLKRIGQLEDVYVKGVIDDDYDQESEVVKILHDILKIDHTYIFDSQLDRDYNFTLSWKSVSK